MNLFSWTSVFLVESLSLTTVFSLLSKPFVLDLAAGNINPKNREKNGSFDHVPMRQVNNFFEWTEKVSAVCIYVVVHSETFLTPMIIIQYRYCLETTVCKHLHCVTTFRVAWDLFTMITWTVWNCLILIFSTVGRWTIFSLCCLLI
jgi:hypothetical protein